MSLSKVHMVLNKISDKFGVYVSLSYSSGFDYRANEKYEKIGVYDEIHNHRYYNSFKKAVDDVETFYAMSVKQFTYESCIEETKRKLQTAKLDFKELTKEIAKYKQAIRTAQLKMEAKK